MSADNSAAIVLAAFEAAERRDQQRLRELYHPEVEFHWPAPLPFGGSSRGGVRGQPGPSWSEVWEPLQPTAVNAVWTLALSPLPNERSWFSGASEPCGQPASARRPRCLASMRSGTGVSRAQMFYFDTTEVLRFLARPVRVLAHAVGAPWV